MNERQGSMEEQPRNLPGFVTWIWLYCVIPIRFFHNSSKSCNGSFKNSGHLLWLKFFQDNNAAPTKESRVQAERRILRCSSYQRYGTGLNVRKKYVLWSNNMNIFFYYRKLEAKDTSQLIHTCWSLLKRWISSMNNIVLRLKFCCSFLAIFTTSLTSLTPEDVADSLTKRVLLLRLLLWLAIMWAKVVWKQKYVSDVNWIPNFVVNWYVSRTKSHVMKNQVPQTNIYVF